MPVELLALTAAFSYGLGSIAVRFGTRNVPIMTGFLVSLGTGIVVLGIYALITLDAWTMTTSAAIAFVLAGIAGPAVGRLLSMLGVRDVGASVANPVQTATNPVLSSIGGVLIFTEQIGPLRALGIGLVVTGVWACAWGGSANIGAVKVGRARLRGLMWPFLAGAAFAVGDVLRKIGLEAEGIAILGALLGITVAFTVWILAALARPNLRADLRYHPQLGWFALHGVLSAIGLTFLHLALGAGELSLVAPIFASQPVMVIVLSSVLLRKHEALRPGIVFGAVIAMAGLVSLSLG